MSHTTIKAVEDECGWGPWWIAHEHPERPHDAFTVWDWTCDRCMFHLQAAAAQYKPDKDDLHDCVIVDGGPNQRLPLPQVLDAAMAWRALNGEPL